MEDDRHDRPLLRTVSDVVIDRDGRARNHPPGHPPDHPRRVPPQIRPMRRLVAATACTLLVALAGERPAR